MLTGDLLRVRFRKDQIYLPYIDEQDQDHLGVAETLIRVFQRHEGGTRQELDEELKDTTGAGTDFLFHRGLSKLLKDRCTFTSESPLPPVDLRRQLFEKAYDRLESEFEVVLKIQKEDVIKKMNKALGREEKILENQ